MSSRSTFRFLGLSSVKFWSLDPDQDFKVLQMVHGGDSEKALYWLDAKGEGRGLFGEEGMGI